jgi:addiction module HigA family antidote
VQPRAPHSMTMVHAPQGTWMTSLLATQIAARGRSAREVKPASRGAGQDSPVVGQSAWGSLEGAALQAERARRGSEARRRGRRKGDRAMEHTLRGAMEWERESLDARGRYGGTLDATRTTMTPKNRMRPIHPGEILREDFLLPLGMSANALAQALHVPANRITMLVAEKRAMTADTALRLARYFGSSAELWLDLQKAFELRIAEQSAEVKAELRSIRPTKTARTSAA